MLHGVQIEFTKHIINEKIGYYIVFIYKRNIYIPSGLSVFVPCLTQTEPSTAVAHILCLLPTLMDVNGNSVCMCTHDVPCIEITGHSMN